MGEGLRRRNEDSLCSMMLPVSCSKSLWWNHLVLLRRASPPETAQARFTEGTHPILFVWLPVFLVAYKYPKALYSASGDGAVSFALPWHTVLDDLHGALWGRERSGSSSYSHSKATGTYK